MHRKNKTKTTTTYYKTCTDIYVFQLIYKVIRRKKTKQKHKTKTTTTSKSNIRLGHGFMLNKLINDDYH